MDVANGVADKIGSLHRWTHQAACAAAHSTCRRFGAASASIAREANLNR